MLAEGQLSDPRGLPIAKLLKVVSSSKWHPGRNAFNIALLFIDIAGSKFWGRGREAHHGRRGRHHYQHHRNNARIVGVGCGAISIMQ